MTDTWYVGIKGQRSGPFTSSQVRQMAARGELGPGDMLWREGMADWVVASTVKGLFGEPVEPVSNPYAPPAATVLDSGSSGVTPTVVGFPSGYSFAAAAELTMRTVRARWGLLVVVGLVLIAVYAALAIPQVGLQIVGVATGDEDMSKLLGGVGSCFGFLLNICFGGPLAAGLFLAGAEIVAGRGRVADLFVGFKRFGRVFLAQLLVLASMFGLSFVAYLPFIVCAVLAAVVGQANGRNETAFPGILIAVGGLITAVLFLSAMALVGTRVVFAPALVADAELGSLGVMDAVRLNWSRVSAKQGWSLLGLAIVVSLIAGFSALLCGIGYVLLGLPIMVAAAGSAYLLLFRSTPQAA